MTADTYARLDAACLLGALDPTSASLAAGGDRAAR
jgi:hypothetical protein